MSQLRKKRQGDGSVLTWYLETSFFSVICTGFLPLDAVYAFSDVSGCLTEMRFARWLNMDNCTFSSSTYGTKLISKSLKGTPLSHNATHKPDLHFPLYQIFAFYNLSNLQIRTLAQRNIK